MKASYLLAVVGAVVSIAASGYAALLASETSVLLAQTPIQIGPIRRELLPPGTLMPKPSVLTEKQESVLLHALVQEPLNQKLFNRLYINVLLRDGRRQKAAEAAQVLSDLGWRYTPSQQNLLLEFALSGEYQSAIDRADGLLRRQKLQAAAYAMLQQLEGIPQSRSLIVNKLREGPAWRQAYLSVLGPDTPYNILEARRLTTYELLSSERGMERGEIAPVISALVQTGRAQAAYDLWRRFNGATASQIVSDPKFAELDAAPNHAVAIPFEWNPSDGVGHTVYATREGLKINWDGRGVPVFASQLVPIRTGQRYRLAVEGRATGGSLANLLNPTLQCGDQIVEFDPLERVPEGATFLSDSMPRGCLLALLAVSGRVDSNGGVGTSIDLESVQLTEGS